MASFLGARQAWKSCPGRKKRKMREREGGRAGGVEWGGGEERLKWTSYNYNDILAVTF